MTDEMETEVRREVERIYRSKQGAVSIFFEMLIRTYLDGGLSPDEITQSARGRGPEVKAVT